MANTFKMPLWGPYSKKYMGISRIADSLSDLGARFDFVAHPTLWNSATPVPNVTVPSAYHLWECAGDYSYYSYRYELMWKDMVYADVSFSEIDSEAYLLRCKFYNNTELSQNCILNLFSSLEFPFYEKIEINSPEKSIIINANDYERYEYAVPRPWDGENPDGMFKGMFRDESFYLGCGLGDRVDNRHVHYYGFKPFGCEKGDAVSYKLKADGFKKPVLAVRYKSVTDSAAEFELNGKTVEFPYSDKLDIICFDFAENPEFVSLGKGGIELDFLAVIEEGESVSTRAYTLEYEPEINNEKVDGGYRSTLDYGHSDCKFYVLTHSENTRFRTLESGSLEDALINRLSNGDFTYDDLCETFSNSFSRKKSDTGFFHNALIKSIFIEPNSTHTEYAVVSKRRFKALTPEKYEKIYNERRAAAGGVKYNGEGARYTLSTSILRASLLTNAVYPVYKRGVNVVHFTPGKRWDSFYTWDSGFIGMGLLEFSDKLCRYSLEQYTSDSENKDFAFLLHGSLVPTQFVQFFELLKRSENKEELRYLYPRMKRYYEFLRGRESSSSFNKFNNGLLTAYDYWYSCSGMDDYPAQSKMILDRAEEYSCPCLTTAQVIRAGKIMKMAAAYFGEIADIAVYDKDIAESERALNTLAWDEESGYFGYTLYNKSKTKPEIMKTENGENWNKGFDGVYPLFAGAVDGERKKRLVEHIKSPREMWSAAGISAVDMSASYYFDDGYWNGNVWMSHQWFAWKTMLDLGDTDFAFEIADRALEMWREETDFSYFTYECFGIKTRRGGWFHNFGGLSAPICIWANAYYKPKTVTTGFDVWTDYQKVSENSAEIKFTYFGNSESYSMLVTLSDENEYRVLLDGVEIPYYERKKGCLEITLDGSIKGGVILCQIKS